MTIKKCVNIIYINALVNIYITIPYFTEFCQEKIPTLFLKMHNTVYLLILYTFFAKYAMMYETYFHEKAQRSLLNASI